VSAITGIHETNLSQRGGVASEHALVVTWYRYALIARFALKAKTHGKIHGL
jgi:hypothetical protein